MMYPNKYHLFNTGCQITTNHAVDFFLYLVCLSSIHPTAHIPSSVNGRLLEGKRDELNGKIYTFVFKNFFRLPELETVEYSTAVKRAIFPYVSGLLAFREGQENR